MWRWPNFALQDQIQFFVEVWYTAALHANLAYLNPLITEADLLNQTNRISPESPGLVKIWRRTS
jgi:hypothetical protein